MLDKLDTALKVGTRYKACPQLYRPHCADSFACVGSGTSAWSLHPLKRAS